MTNPSAVLQRARSFAARVVHGGVDGHARLHERFLEDLIRHTDNFGHLTWMGHPIWQNVLDLWSLQEAIEEIKPAVLLETGTNQGGSALFYAHLFDLVGRGRVVTVDVERMHSLEHRRIEFLVGSSLDDEVLTTMRRRVQEVEADGAVMVVLDSAHDAAHVLAELHAYAPLVTPGSLLLVQDGVIDTLPMFAAFRPGPLRAIEEFLAGHPEFEVDARLDKRFLITHHPSGWLRRR